MGNENSTPDMSSPSKSPAARRLSAEGRSLHRSASAADREEAAASSKPRWEGATLQLKLALTRMNKIESDLRHLNQKVGLAIAKAARQQVVHDLVRLESELCMNAVSSIDGALENIEIVTGRESEFPAAAFDAMDMLKYKAAKVCPLDAAQARGKSDLEYVATVLGLVKADLQVR